MIGAGKLAQQLKILVFAEVPSSISNSSSRGIFHILTSWAPGTHMVHRHASSQNIHTHKIIKK